MPELPEVETIKNSLLNLVHDLTITKVDVLRASTIVGDPNEFSSTIKGKTILDISRIGKYMIFHLSDEICFISHLRMEGKYYKLNESEPNSYYSRVVFHLSDNTKLCYDDSRCFGILKLTSEKEFKSEKEIAKLGPEPFAVNDPMYLLEKAKRKSVPIKTFLLDQTVMTGLGNIYVDETLFACNIHPLRRAETITYDEFNSILKNSKIILNNAIKSGGSTIRSYHPGKGIDGNFQVQLKAYGKVGENCPTCGHPFRKIRVGGRGTTFCPICQKYHGKKLNIAICGPISSGKSTVLKGFSNNGYDVLSCDDVVHDLYKNADVSAHIEKLLNLKFNKNFVDIDMLRSHLSKNIADKNKLERYIFPLVKEKVELFLQNSLTKITAVEVPLLYDAKMEGLFDIVIFVESHKAMQLLATRDENNNDVLAKINTYASKFEKYKKEADIIMTNDKDMASFEGAINNLINKDLAKLLD